MWPVLTFLITCCGTYAGAQNLAEVGTPDQSATNFIAAPTIAQPLPCVGGGCLTAANMAPPVASSGVGVGNFGQQFTSISLPAAPAMQQGLKATSGVPIFGTSPTQDFAQVKSTVAGLAQENAVLRDQLTEWRTMGKDLADREARVAQFLAKVRHERLSRKRSQQRLLETDHKTEEASSSGTESEQRLERDLVQVPHYAWLALQCILLVTVCFVLYQLREHAVHHKGDDLDKDVSAHRGRWFVPLTPLRQRLGIGPCTIEVSELELRIPGNPLVTDGFSVGFQGGHSSLMKTRAVAGTCRIVGSYSCISFTEVFRTTVNSLDSVCTFSMHDQESNLHGVVARAELPVRMLTKMAAQAQGFARIDFSWEDAEQQNGEQQASDEPQPYLALRIRTF